MIPVGEDTRIELSLTTETAWALAWLLSPLPGPVAAEVYDDLKASLRGLVRT